MVLNVRAGADCRVISRRINLSKLNNLAVQLMDNYNIIPIALLLEKNTP